MLTFIENFVSRWDGNSYLFLAHNGYVTKGSEAAFVVFPPFYPFTIRVINYFLQNLALSAFLISTFSFILAMFVFYKLLIIDYTKKKTIWIITTLIFFPTSYFFFTAYPESVFLLLILLTFLFMRRKNFLLASIFGAFATLTRPFGVLLWMSLLLEWFKEDKKISTLFLIFSFMSLSVSIYLSLNYSLFGNAFAFQNFLQNHWQKSFTFPWNSLVNSWQRGISTPDNNPEYKYLVGYAEAIASTIAYVFIIINILFKKIRMRLSYLAYLSLATLLMTSTSFLLSTPRYLLSIPVFFITLGNITNHTFLKIIWGTLSISLLVFFSYLFIKGRWAF